MSVLSTNIANATAQLNISQDEKTRILGLLAPMFWAWFTDHSDDKVVERRILFFSVSIHIRDLRGLFIMLFGQPPLGV